MGAGATKDSLSVKSETVLKSRLQINHSQRSDSKASISDVTTTVVRVNVSKSGFWPPAVTIKEGQCVLFIWSEPSGSGHNIRQVVYDGVDLQVAVGGYRSGDIQPQGKYKIQFNLEGEFKFVSDGFHNTTTKPFIITVHSRPEIPAELTDDGFSPTVIRINQGNTVKWVWNSCQIPHTLCEVKLCPKHCGLIRTNNGTSVPSTASSYKYEFASPGLYYFQTEGTEEGQTHLCIVQVKEIQREYRVEVTDRKFNPRLLCIQEGDRVWWEWDRLKEKQASEGKADASHDDETSTASSNSNDDLGSEKCRKGHNVIQVSVPQYSDEMDPYPRPVKGGFRCEGPSRSGVLSHVFKRSGVYYYCDQDYDNNREYLGVIIVKPKEKEHYIELTGDGFYPDLAAISAGDRVWWIWNPEDVKDHFSIMEVDRCVAGDVKISQDQDCLNMCTYVNNDASHLLSALGIETIQLNTVGVYHYRVSDSPVTVGCSSIIVNPKARDHTVLITNEGFEPRVSTLNPGDRVWWIWEDCTEQQNILQVSHQGRPIKDGFCSGAPLDSPGAFANQFKETGVYYFISMGQPKAFGAIVVSSQQQVARVKVSKSTIQPDPVLALTNDVVVWMWPGLRKHGITQVTDTQQIYELQSYTQDIVTPRRCFAQRFSNPGIYHYYSKAFSGNDNKYLYEHSSKCVLSTVIINNASDSTVVHVTSRGFKPSTVNILRGQNLLWSWKDSGEECHNIVHVCSPDDEKPFTPVTDETAFNSGPPVANNSFIYTFDEPGSYYVTSQGSPGSVGTINILDRDQFKLTAMPLITTEVNGGTVEKCHTIKLQCNTENSTIFYTLDGSNPEYHGPSTKVYKSNKGIILRTSGLHVIRAMATSEDALNSKIFTSRRFWVLEGEHKSEAEEDIMSSASSSEEQSVDDDEDARVTMKWHWWNCVPDLQGWLVNAGCVELYWELPEEMYLPQIKTYQVYVNNVCYCEALPKDCHSVRVVGLAGGFGYIMKIVALPKESHFLPQESNKLTVHIPSSLETGGPLISTEFVDDDDVMAIVWMTIPDTQTPIRSYRLYVNDQKCGDEVIPDEGSNKCKVLIQGCESNTPYRVQVVAVPKGKKSKLPSNELVVMLPQMNAHIILPQGRSLLEEELQGYITVTRGSGMPPDSNQELLASSELAIDVDWEKSNTHTETIVTQANIHLEEKQDDQVTEHAICSEDDNSDISDGKSLDSKGEVHTEQDTEKDTEADAGQPSEGALEQAPEGDLKQPAAADPEHPPDREPSVDAECAPVAKVEEEQTTEAGTVPPVEDDGKQSVVKEPSTESSGSQEVEGKTAEEEDDSTERAEHPNDGVLLSERTGTVTERDGEHHYETEHSPDVDLAVEEGNDTKEGEEKDEEVAAELEEKVEEEEAKTKDEPKDNDDIDDDDEVSSLGSSVGTDTANISISDLASDKKSDHVAISEMHAESTECDTMHVGGDANAEPSTNLNDTNRCLDTNTMHADSLVHDLGGDLDNGDGGSDRGVQATDSKVIAHVHVQTHKKRKKKKKKKDGSEIDAVAKAQQEIQELPVPRVEVTSKSTRPEILVEWKCEKSLSKKYIMQHYLVCIVGAKFEDVQSHNSFETVDIDGKICYQHCWSVKDSIQLKIKGLAESTHYRIFVSSVFSHKKRSEEKVELKSDEVTCISGGRPGPPRLTVNSIGLHEVGLSWTPGLHHPDVSVAGYSVFINGKVLGEMLSQETTASQIQDIEIGSRHQVYVESVSSNGIGNSDPSNVITIITPEPQNPPILSSLPSLKNRAALIAWEKPRGSDAKLISAYRVYVDGKEVGELDIRKADRNLKHYQYYITELQAGVSYDVTVRTYTGQKEFDSSSGSVYCGVLSLTSNVLPVMCTAPPRSPRVRLQGLHNRGIDVTWEIPQQYGDAALSGFQLVKDGKLYGPIINPDTLSATVSNISLGDTVALQIIALTNHPVGRLGQDDAFACSSDSGFDNASTFLQEDKETPLMEKYSACKPGPKLPVTYTGLVQPPSKVWCERVTGHSAVIAWSKDEKKRRHYVSAENYQVTWWPGQTPRQDIQSQSTTGDHLNIGPLQASTKYTVVVEARRSQMYNTYSEEDTGPPEERGCNTFIVTSQSEQLSIMTGCPPDPPSNIGLITSTCNSLQIAWHSPVEHGIEVIGLRVHVVPEEESKIGLSQCIELVPDVTTLTIRDLSESTEYTVYVMAVTEEYFDQLPGKSKHKKKLRASLPRDWEKVPKDSIWLPYTSMHAVTSGTRPPTDLHCVHAGIDAIAVKWTPPQVHGTNKLHSCVVRWSQVRPGGSKDLTSSHGSIPVNVEDSAAEITGLTPGKSYRIYIETHISVKTSIGEQTEEEEDLETYRNAQVTSATIVVRTKAPVEPAEVLLTGYSSEHITLYWEKPVLFTQMPNKDIYGCGSCLKRTLIGYRLEVNGRTHTRLGPSAQSCTLTKCKADKRYSIVLIALTSTDKDAKKKRKKMDSKGSDQKNGAPNTDERDDVEDYDEAASKPVDIILPKPQSGAMISLEAKFTRNASKKNANEHRCGFIDVQWAMQLDSDDTTTLSEIGLQGFDVTYTSSHSDKEQTATLPTSSTSYEIPIQAERSVYNISVQPVYDDDFFYSESPSVQFQCPGSPEPPQLCCTALQSNSITIEWGEPKLYGGVDVKGYQAFMNEKKIGNVLNSSHRKAVIPCMPQKQYTISMIALSADINFDQSLPSEDLVVITPAEYQDKDTSRSTCTTSSTYSNDNVSLIQEVNVFISEVTENMISLSWVINGVDELDIRHIQVQWSSVANPQVLDTKVAAEETEFTIYRCTSGTRHFIRVYVMGYRDKLICKSKQLTVQTSAVIATPALSLSSCTFTHITVGWLEPKTYGDTELIAYKLVISGLDPVELPPHITTYTFTSGEMCKEYKFTVQALCDKENLHSEVSEPVRVVWPGILAPTLRRVPTNKRNTLKVAWNDLYTTGDIKIASFKGICDGECYTSPSGRIPKQKTNMQEVGPLHPEARVMELTNLLPNVNYQICLEICIHGLETPIRSEVLVAQIASVPGPPDVRVTVHGADARRRLDIETCELINKRDRLLQQLDLCQSTTLQSYTKKPSVQIARLTSSLIDVETKLLQCMEDLQPYSGTFDVDVEWNQVEDDGDAVATGYQILINGKQHGSLFNSYVQQTKLTLSAYVPVHKLSIVTVTNHPVGNSEPSEVIPIYSEAFLPFSSFCFHSVHTKDTRYPNEGCCLYTDSLAKEMDPDCRGSYSIVAVNQGLLKRRVPPAAVTVLDVFEGAWHLLIPSRMKKPAMILFWTKWCLASKIAMKFFVQYSRERGKRISFITSCCAGYESMSSHRHSLAEIIVENGWRDDRSVRHCCSCHSTTPGLNTAKKSTSTTSLRRRAKLVHQDSSSSGDSTNATGVAELFAIQGVPTIIVINPEGYIAWQGRYAAYEYSSFQAFADHVMCETMAEPCLSDCELCREQAGSEIPKLKPLPGNPKHVKVLVSAPSTSSSEATTTGLATWPDDEDKTQEVERPQSGKQGRLRQHKQLPVASARPYSAMSPRATTESLTRIQLGRPKSSYSA